MPKLHRKQSARKPTKVSPRGKSHAVRTVRAGIPGGDGGSGGTAVRKTRHSRAVPAVIPKELTKASRGQRLQKVLAEAGVASRRDCESLITKGSITVNGQLVTLMPAWADPEADRIEVDGRPIRRLSRHKKSHKKQYVVVHKPRNVVSTSSDPDGRPCVTGLVDLPTRLFPVGRLDADSSGLMLLTNDGELTNRLTHPRYEVPKQYLVSVRGRVTEDDLKNLKQGIYLAHAKATSKKRRPPGAGAKLASMARVKLIGYSRDRAHGDRTNLMVTLREGQNREIRRMLAKLGHKVRRLERVGIGPIKLKGLAPGQWRLLTGREVSMLQKAAGIWSAKKPRPASGATA